MVQLLLSHLPGEGGMANGGVLVEASHSPASFMSGTNSILLNFLIRRPSRRCCRLVKTGGRPTRARLLKSWVVKNRSLVLYTQLRAQPRSAAIYVGPSPSSNLLKQIARCHSGNSHPRIRLPLISVPKSLMVVVWCGFEEQSVFWCWRCGMGHVRTVPRLL